ncbi:MAG: hypothetical protein AAF196_09090 [Planctomycetota bacterium]
MISTKIREALRLIDREGWLHIGQFHNHGYDLVSALQTAFSGVPHGGVLGEDYRVAHKQLQRMTGTRLLSAWNDDPKRCKHEVLGLLAQAAQHFEEKEANA